MKSSSATRFCKVCFEPIRGYSLSRLFNESCLCDQCFNKLNPKMKTEIKKGIKYTTLYEYKDEIRDLLFQFKAAGDYELAPIFIGRQSPMLRLLFHGYYLIPAPSYIDRENKRGFSHVVEMYKPLGLPFIDCLTKTKDVKQANLDFKKRQKIGNYLRIDEKANLQGKKILFVDDVVTSGATSLAAVKLIKNQHPKCVRVLAMARTLLS